MRESEPLSVIKGVGKKTSGLFENLRVYSLGDILSFFPRAYENYPKPVKDLNELEEGAYCAFSGMYFVRPVTKHLRGLTITSGKLTGHEAEIETVWFRMPYLTNQIQTKLPYVAYGRVSKKGSHYRMDQPRLFEIGEYEALTRTPQPVYSLTKGLSNKTVVKIVREALNLCLPVGETLPRELLLKRSLMERSLAISTMHHPKSIEELEKAKKRFTYEEFLSFFLGHLLQERNEILIENHFLIKNDSYFNNLQIICPLN